MLRVLKYPDNWILLTMYQETVVICICLKDVCETRHCISSLMQGPMLLLLAVLTKTVKKLYQIDLQFGDH